MCARARVCACVRVCVCAAPPQNTEQTRKRKEANYQLGQAVRLRPGEEYEQGEAVRRTTIWKSWRSLSALHSYPVFVGVGGRAEAPPTG